MKRLTIKVDKALVLSLSAAGRILSAAIAKLLTEKGMKIVSQNFNTVEADMEDTLSLDSLRQEVAAMLGEKFSISSEDANEKISFNLEPVAKAREADRQKLSPLINALKEQMSEAEIPVPQADAQPLQEVNTDKAEAAMADIETMLGAREFIALCRRIHKVAPMLKNRRLPHILLGRSYLFSIDDGYGLSTTLQKMAKLFEALEISVPGAKPGQYLSAEPVEIPLDPPSSQGNPLERLAKELSSVKNKLLCLDITTWSDKVNTPEFRDFLHNLLRNNDKMVYVFRVPYLEHETLNRIQSAIADVMTVDTVSFVPLTQDELTAIATDMLKGYGITATGGAWELFQQRLAEERSDGRFYGIKTAKKVVDEMVYRKYLALADSEFGDETQISEDDLRGFVRADTTVSAAERMEKLVGIEAIRDKLEEIIRQIQFARSNEGVKAPAMHMRFLGNPGTGKTTVARIVGQLLKERGILSKGYFFEHTGGDFLGMWVGHTAPKVNALCRDAYGSVMFIDEAYTLASANYVTGSGFAKEAIDTLIAQMENHRDDLVVIMAGYPREMDELMAVNPGLKGRIPYTLEFPNYSREELYQIFLRMASGDGFTLTEDADSTIHNYFLNLPGEILGSSDFSNARFVRNLFERTWSKTIMRSQLDGTDPRTICAADFEAAAGEDVKSIGKKQQSKRPHPGFRLGMV